MRAGLLSVWAVFVLAPTLVLVALSAHSHAAAGRPARPNAAEIVHLVSSSRHFRPPPRSSHRLPGGSGLVVCLSLRAGPTAFPLQAGSGEGECPSPSASPSPSPTVTSPSPNRTTSAPSSTSPATPPTVHPPPVNRLGRHRPSRAPHGASATFSRVHGSLLLWPATRTQAGLSIRLLMVLVLVPCAAAAVLRYGGKR